MKLTKAFEAFFFGSSIEKACNIFLEGILLINKRSCLIAHDEWFLYCSVVGFKLNWVMMNPRFKVKTERSDVIEVSCLLKLHPVPHMSRFRTRCRAGRDITRELFK